MSVEVCMCVIMDVHQCVSVYVCLCMCVSITASAPFSHLRLGLHCLLHHTRNNRVQRAATEDLPVRQQLADGGG